MLRFQYKVYMNSGITKWGIFSAKSGYFYYAIHTNVVEMDTVVGPEPGKVLLTMLFRNSTFMLAFLIENTKRESVIRVLHFLQQALGTDVFSRLFPVILTDRGPEFSHPWALESDEYGEILSKVFYCNANAPYQKGRLEKNHEFLRYILPKGTSFDAMTQEDITLALNHINSTAKPVPRSRVWRTNSCGTTNSFFG